MDHTEKSTVFKPDEFANQTSLLQKPGDSSSQTTIMEGGGRAGALVKSAEPDEGWNYFSKVLQSPQLQYVLEDAVGR